MPPENPRFSALKVLDRYSERNVNLSRLIQERVSRYGDAPGRRLVRELVWGTVRRLNSLDWIIDRFVRRADRLEPPVRNILRVGLFQLLYADERMPAYAAVNETVNLCRAAGRSSAAGLVNAVMRRALRERDALPWPRTEPEALSLRYSHPVWLVRRWTERFGEAGAASLLEADNAPPPLTVRANTLRTTRERLKALLDDEGVPSSECRFSPDGLVLRSSPELERLESCSAGLFTVQDEASQLISRLLGPEPGSRVLDLCAGAGVKAGHLVQLSRGEARVTAVDNAPGQAGRARENFARMGFGQIAFVTEDARRVTERADRILVDAPCSGLGVIRRKPDIKWNRTGEDIGTRYPVLQKEILSHAAGLLEPGGRLVYSTCTTEPEENEEVVEHVLERHRGTLGLLPAADAGADPALTDGPWFRTRPDRHGTDGFFAACLVRR